MCESVRVFIVLTLGQTQWRVDQRVQRAWRPVAEWSREARNQTGKHAELLAFCVTLQRLHPQQEQAHAFTADLQRGRAG